MLLATVELPKDFFTVQSMLTLTGAAGATFVIANGIQAAFNFNPRWLALLIAQALSAFGVYASKGSGSDYVVGFVNGFLIFCTAAGSTAMLGTNNATTVPMRGSVGAQVEQTLRRRGFLTPW